MRCTAAPASGRAGAAGGELLPLGATVVYRAADGELLLPLPVDRLSWTRQMQTVFRRRPPACGARARVLVDRQHQPARAARVHPRAAGAWSRTCPTPMPALRALARRARAAGELTRLVAPGHAADGKLGRPAPFRAADEPAGAGQEFAASDPPAAGPVFGVVFFAVRQAHVLSTARCTPPSAITRASSKACGSTGAATWSPSRSCCARTMSARPPKCASSASGWRRRAGIFPAKRRSIASCSARAWRACTWCSARPPWSTDSTRCCRNSDQSAR